MATWWVMSFFPGISWQEGSLSWGAEKDETGRDEDEWIVPTGLRELCLLAWGNYVFLPEKSVAWITGKHFHLLWRPSWNVSLSDEGAERSWNLRLELWASVGLRDSPSSHINQEHPPCKVAVESHWDQLLSIQTYTQCVVCAVTRCEGLRTQGRVASRNLSLTKEDRQVSNIRIRREKWNNGNMLGE